MTRKGSPIQTPSHRSYRLVCPESQIEQVEALLAAQGFDGKEEPFSPLCRTLDNEPRPLGSSLAAFFGLIYIQDRSSMLPPLALNPPPGARVLDMCASPGGKTSFLAQLVGPKGFVLANEPNRDRLQTLRQNLLRLNLLQTATCSFPGENLPLPPESFAYILLDPPCSGWGTEKKHPKVRTLWKEDKITPLAALQKQLLREAARLLAPGGKLLYSTCTTNVAENEDQILWALENLPMSQTPLSEFPGFAYAPSKRPEIQGCLRIDEELSQAQGFFLAALRKSESISDTPEPEPGQKLKGDIISADALAATGAEPDFLPPGECRSFNGRLFFLHYHALQTLDPPFRYQGYPLGRLTKSGIKIHPRVRTLLPDKKHESKHLERVDIPDTAGLEALLSGRSLDQPAKIKTTAKYAGLYYNNLPLAWLQRKGNRLLWSDR